MALVRATDVDAGLVPVMDKEMILDAGK